MTTRSFTASRVRKTARDVFVGEMPATALRKKKIRTPTHACLRALQRWSEAHFPTNDRAASARTRKRFGARCVRRTSGRTRTGTTLLFAEPDVAVYCVWTAGRTRR